MHQIACTSCGKSLQVPEDRLPPHLKMVKGRCPHCREEIGFANPRYKEPEFDPHGPAVAVFQSIPALLPKNLNRRYTLKEGPNILGRTGDVALPDDAFASRIHCTVEVCPVPSGYRLILADDGSASPTGQPSRNGTFLNGERLGPLDKMLLLPGDIIRVGHTELVVVG